METTGNGLLDELMAALPRCWRCAQAATKRCMEGDDLTCDDCDGRVDGGRDLPYAPAVRKWAARQTRPVQAPASRAYAFWKYDRYPYLLGAPVEVDLGGGRVRPSGYGGYVFTVEAQLPAAEGREGRAVAVELAEGEWCDRLRGLLRPLGLSGVLPSDAPAGSLTPVEVRAARYAGAAAVVEELAARLAGWHAQEATWVAGWLKDRAAALRAGEP